MYRAAPSVTRRKWATYLSLPASAGNNASTPDNAVLDITDEIDLRAHVALSDWTPAAVQAAFSKYTGGVSTSSYSLRINTTGTINTLFHNGTSAGSYSSTAAVTFANGVDGWIRATWRDSDGRVQFLTSTDGSAWTQLGTDVDGSGLGAINSTNAILEIGSRGTNATDRLSGKVFRVQVYAGIDGDKVFDADFTKGPAYATSFTDTASGLVVTVNQTGTTPAQVLFA